MKLLGIRFCCVDEKAKEISAFLNEGFDLTNNIDSTEAFAGGVFANEDGNSWVEKYRPSDMSDIVDHKEILDILNRNYVPYRQFKGPLFLSRYGSWVDWRENRKLNLSLDNIMNLMEGEKSVLDLAMELDIPFDDLYQWLEKLYQNGLIMKREIES